MAKALELSADTLTVVLIRTESRAGNGASPPSRGSGASQRPGWSGSRCRFAGL